MVKKRDMFIIQPHGPTRLGDLLKQLLHDDDWSHFSASVAFVKRSGVQYIADALRAFSKRGVVKMLVGVDLGGTSREGLSDLLACIEGRGEIWVCHNENVSTFHPKVYIFRNESKAIIVVGSGNLTEGGLFTNYEVSIIRDLDLNKDDDRNLLSQIESAFEHWLSPETGTSHLLTPEFLNEMYQLDYVVDEYRTRGEEKSIEEKEKGGVSEKTRLFARARVLRPPAVLKRTKTTDTKTPETTKESTGKGRKKIEFDRVLLKHPEIGGILQELDALDSHNDSKKSSLRQKLRNRGFHLEDKKTWDIFIKEAESTARPELPLAKSPRPISAIPEKATQATHKIFVMTLQQTDCGVGQRTAGTLRRSPEIFIPLAARNYDADFWGWKDEFKEDPSKKGKYDRSNVSMELDGKVIHVNMMTWPAKHDFRLRSEALRSAGSVGDILKIKKTDGRSVSYHVEVISRSSSDYTNHLRLCSHNTPNSKKRWGYF